MSASGPPARDGVRLRVCVNPVGTNKPCCGGDRGAERLARALEVGIEDRRIDAALERVHCLNRCLQGPAIRIAPGGRFFLGVTEAALPDILDALEDVAGTRPAGGDPFDFGGGVPGG
jgi:NADH:ubiquinone oxidoreductase subunit E